ncbi:MAG TPA: phospholipase D-like domain-containing protein [Acidimicrobiales bacterium]|nr:phospholipase D-like domain-containing protein [Acidimicrobiales bacterium]
MGRPKWYAIGEAVPGRWLPTAAAVTGTAAVGAYVTKVVQYRREARHTFHLSDPPAPGNPEFARLVEMWCGGPLRPGNRVDVLRNGAEIFPSMLDAIASASRTIDFSTYIFWKGETATRFGEAFIERARAGVEVNVMVDGWGSAPMDRALVARMQDAGVNFVWFRTPHWYTTQKLNNRTHRRIMVVDGSIGFTGGLGVADEWSGDAEGPKSWRETHLRIEGPAVRDLLGAFADNWMEETGTVLSGPHLPPIAALDDGVEIQLSKSSASQGRAAAESLFLAAIAGARERLWFTTAYFSPRQALVDELAAAAGRGVDLRILVNGPHIDKQVVRRAGHRSYGQLLEAGVRLFEYQRTMMHAKVVVADDSWANVGTSNFDNRSLALQDEMNCSVSDQGVVAELEKHFVEDFDDSEEIDFDRWRRRPLRSRAYESVSGAVRPSL